MGRHILAFVPLSGRQLLLYKEWVELAVGKLIIPAVRPLGLAAVQVTHLFRDALHGWGQVVLSVNVSPCAKDYDETSHVLKVCQCRR